MTEAGHFEVAEGKSLKIEVDTVTADSVTIEKPGVLKAVAEAPKLHGLEVGLTDGQLPSVHVESGTIKGFDGAVGAIFKGSSQEALEFRDFDVEAIALGDRLPVTNRGATHRIGPDADPRPRDGIHLGFNLFALLNVGTVLEGVYRRGDYVLLLVVSGLSTMLTSAVMSGESSSTRPRPAAWVEGGTGPGGSCAGRAGSRRPRFSFTTWYAASRMVCVER